MENLVPLGTGNSRLMKSNIPSNTTLAQLIQMWNNGTFPYDIGPLNSAGISQQGTPLNKATLLKDATAALYGLTNTAVPDDVLTFLGKYNQYWWKRRTKTSVEGDLEDLLIFRSTQSSSDYYCIYNYSSGFDDDSNKLKLTDPITEINIGYGVNGTTTRLNGKYFELNSSRGQLSHAVSGHIYKGYSSVKRSDTGSYYECHISCREVFISVGEWEYVQSSDRNAYPDSGIQNGYEYQFLGRPLDNAVEGSKIETGSYAGTGTYGENNPTIINLSFDAKLVLILGTGSASGGFILADQLTSEYTLGATAYDLGQDSQSSGRKDGTTIYIYSSTNVNLQFNNGGVTYKYYAFG